MLELNHIYQGDCIEVMKQMDDNSVDAVVTDPPYELGFMGKHWDASGIAYNVDVWKECLRVLKPGGHLLAFGGTRTYHRMACAIEDAGFEVRDMIEWVYGSGFPKSHNIGLRLDQKLGLQGFRGKETSFSAKTIQGKYVDGRDKVLENGKAVEKYEGKSEIAKQYQGWGTALKPSHESICMARKPLSEKTVAENCLKWGTGGINIDESRISLNGEEQPSGSAKRIYAKNQYDANAGYGDNKQTPISGRFPANLIHDNSDEVRACFPETGKSAQNKLSDNRQNQGNSMFIDGVHNPENSYGDSGNASRFFKSIIYQAKASKAERDRGCENFPISRPDTRTSTGMGSFEQKGVLPGRNSHPCVKPVALMEYLINMVTPKGGIVLDPFMGSGTTGVAAANLGVGFIGIELDEEYCKIAEARIDKAMRQKDTVLEITL